MKSLILSITLLLSLSAKAAGFMEKYVGSYKPLISPICDENNVITDCPEPIDTVDIYQISESPKAFKIVFNNSDLNKYTVQGADIDDSKNDQISRGVITQTDTNLFYIWATNDGLYAPSLQRAELIQVYGGFIQIKISTERKGEYFGQHYYLQSGIDVTLEKK